MKSKFFYIFSLVFILLLISSLVFHIIHPMIVSVYFSILILNLNILTNLKLKQISTDNYNIVIYNLYIILKQLYNFFHCVGFFIRSI